MNSNDSDGNLEQSQHVASFFSLQYWVGNPLANATYFISRFGFEACANRTLTSSIGGCDFSTHVVKQNNIYIAFTSALKPTAETANFGQFLSVHGDSVRNITLSVTNCEYFIDRARQVDDKCIIQEPAKISDKFGSVIVAKIQSFGNVIHTLVENIDYQGPYLPGFIQSEPDVLSNITPSPGLKLLDHLVGVLEKDKLDYTINWYIFFV
eukprot:TRINITY_DN589_c0_g1_i1.p1 TRINITY_DN589_c0_g1~~TRINITY_DN589_c0_g1_i1.p1  ORF type:complete len:209 (-),score=37.36 TRINITY_DN589_c0_g1_i1:613-1239(-)